jgi:hypothetical protein
VLLLLAPLMYRVIQSDVYRGTGLFGAEFNLINEIVSLREGVRK